jgi:hypothetical protein
MLTLLIGTAAFFRNKGPRLLSRVARLLAVIGEVFDEMQEMRRAAHKRHPFVEM